MHLMQRLRKIIRRHQLHQPINREPPLAIPLNHLGHILRRMRTTFNRTNPLLACNHELETRHASQRVIERRRANLDILAMVPSELHAGVHEHRGAGRVDCDGGSNAVGEFFDDVAEGLAFVELAAVDDVRCASSLARSRRDCTLSMPIIMRQPWILAPIMADRPTPPSPMMQIASFGPAPETLTTVPLPV